MIHTPTLEQLALARLRGKFPNLRREGFSGAVRAVDPEIDREGRVPFIPDGWFVEQATFTCVEVEDANPLSPEKLWCYCELWDSLDFYDHHLRLLVFDRYGLNQR